MTATADPALRREAAPAPPALVAPVPAWALLALGAAATLLVGPRYGVAALAWLVPVPYLLFARRIRTWRGWLVLTGVLATAQALQLLQIATAPISPVMAIGFGAPTGVGAAIGVALAELVRRRGGEVAGIYGFAALTAVADWMAYGASPLGAWAATANSQVGSLVVMQLGALVGLAGIGFLMAWCAAAIASLVGAPAPRARARHLAAAALVVAVGLGYGMVRLDAEGGRTATVAAVVTDLGLDAHGIPSADALAANADTLFARTRLAAARGAQLVVWNEAATLVAPGDEAAFVERGRSEARAAGVDLVLAYGVILGRAPLRFDNKYAFIGADGAVLDTYRKHHPVPGEPSLRGVGPMHALDRPYARVGGAICYDYDFPALAREHARAGAELVVVPSSDWRGIDPVHTFMARGRAIEGGFSVVRATRWGASGAFDAYGRVRAMMPVTEDNDRVMIARVPVARVATVYAAVGDAPVLVLAGAILAVIAGTAVRRRRRGR